MRIASRISLLWMTTLLFAVHGNAETPPTMDDVHRLGELIELDGAQLYIPHAAKADAGQVDVIVHFHGGLTYLSREIERYRFNAVLIYFSPGGLSSAYRKPFEDEQRFDRLLGEAKQQLAQQPGWPSDVGFGRLVVTSFSAGYGAVRELLKQPGYVDRIDALLLCDSLYAGYVGEAETPRVNPAHMAGFVDFARLAVAGEKHFTFTHSYIVPPGYAGTHETADYLVQALGMRWQPIDAKGPGGMHRDRQSVAGNFRVIGGRGDDAIAHVLHLREAGFFLHKMGVLDEVSSEDAVNP